MLGAVEFSLGILVYVLSCDVCLCGFEGVVVLGSVVVVGAASGIVVVVGEVSGLGVLVVSVIFGLFVVLDDVLNVVVVAVVLVVVVLGSELAVVLEDVLS